MLEAPLYLDPRIYSKDFVKQLQEKLQNDLLAGVTITQLNSEGTQFQGVQAVSNTNLANAIQNYWDEVNGELITETQPNFNTFGINPL